MSTGTNNEVMKVKASAKETKGVKIVNSFYIYKYIFF